MEKQEPQNIYNIPDDQVKMPESDFLDTEPAVGKIPTVPILFFLILILIAILGGLIWWGKDLLLQNQAPVVVSLERPSNEVNNEPESTTAEAQVETLNAMSTSDELGAIEGDLIGTNVDNLDTEMTAVEAELGTE